MDAARTRGTGIEHEGSVLQLLRSAKTPNADLPARQTRTLTCKFRAAIDVFPVEPVPADDPVRTSRNILLSAHLAGGTRDSYRRIAELLIDEIPQILKGLPAHRLQRAEPRLAAMQRSR